MTEQYQNIKEQLQVEISKFNTNYVANAIGENTEHYKILWELILTEKHPIPWKAAWVFDTIAERHQYMVEPYILDIIENLSKFDSDGVKRNMLRILTRSNLPFQNSGLLFNICYDWMTSGAESIAVKVHAMQICYDISEKEKEIKPELHDTIETIMSANSVGFQNRAGKLLKKLKKEIWKGV